MIACQAAVIRLDAELAHQPPEIAEATVTQQTQIAETPAIQQLVIATQATVLYNPDAGSSF